MKPHARIRKTIKWGGATVIVLLLVAWIGSGWLNFRWVSAGGPIVEIGGGRVFFGTLPPQSAAMEQGFRFDLQRGPWAWGLDGRSGTFGWHVRAPIWIPLAATLVFTAVARRLDTLARRRERADRLNLCPKCGYERTGLRGGSGAVCPECGAIPTPG